MGVGTKTTTDYYEELRTRYFKRELGYVPEEFFGFAIADLSDRQIQLAIDFIKKTQPWLEANIGNLNEEWFVDVDKDANSLRLTFKNDELETYFKLSWMQMNHEDDD